ncbi:MAG: FtsX-like permease family protein [Planctomycetota bacterium]|nr:MAG: FtsX-like permease family protein [Planctomycetota bacterium]
MKTKLVLRLLKEDWGKTFWIYLALSAMAILVTMILGITMILPQSLEATFVQSGPTGSFSFSKPLNYNERKLVKSFLGKNRISYLSFSVEKGFFQKTPLPLVILPTAPWRSFLPYWDIQGKIPSRTGEILMGIRLAKFFKVKAGDTLDLVWGRTTKRVKVVGLLFSGDIAEKQIFLSHSFGFPKAFDTFLFRSSPKKIPQIRKFLESLGIPFQMKLNSQIYYGQKKILEKMKLLSLFALGATLILASITLASIVIARVFERKKEFALLGVLGAGQWDYLILFLGEGFFIGLFASLTGFLLGSWIIQKLAWQVFHQRVMPSIAAFGVTLTIIWLTAAFVGIFGLKEVLKLEPAELLRGE